MSETQDQDNFPGLSTTDMDISAVMKGFEKDAPPPPPDDPPPQDTDDVPIYIKKGSQKAKSLVKNEDREVRDRYVGATYEVHQFNLWKEEDLKAYQSLMTSVGTDKYSRVVFQERMYLQDKQSWTILVEIQHFTLVSR